MNDQMLINLVYIAAAALFVFGLKMLGSPATARRGNMLSATGMLLAIVVTLLSREILGLPVPRIAEGEPAELTVFDAETEWTFEERHIQSKSTNTPFVGAPMVGRAWAVYHRGQLVEAEA